jgi:MFS family permease
VSVLGGGAGVRRGVFLHDSRGASLTLASIAVTAYTGSQTVGPLVGDRLTLRYGRTSLFRAEGLLSTAGLAIAVASPHPALSLGGFAICGLGSSVLLPLTFSAAGHARAESAAFLSRFTTFTYGGIVLGPALIGWVAQLVGLTWTLAGLVPILACTALCGRLPAATRTAR